MVKATIALLGTVWMLAAPAWGQSLSNASVTATGGQTATLASWFQGVGTSGANKTLAGTLVVNLGSVAQASIAGRVIGLQSTDGLNTAALLDASANYPRVIGRRVNGTFASPTAIAANDILFAIEARGYDGSAYTTTHATIELAASENWSGAAQGGQISFKTTPNGNITSGFVRMTVANSGNVLIGTTTDNATDKLQVSGTARANVLATGAGALTLTTGAVGMSKMTASASAPGAAGGKIELVCGTNAGTAKLVAYAGTSGTAVTILDNIGAGVTGC